MINKEKTILVSGASGIVGYGILKSLKASGQNLKLIGTTIYDDSVAQGFCDIFEKAPLTTDETYFPWLVEIIKKYNVDMIIPSIEADMIAWNEHRRQLENTGCVVLLNNSDLINLCIDKWLFYQELKKNNSEYIIPTTLDIDQKELEYPLLLKPRRGYGSQGIVIVENIDELATYENDIGKKLMIQPLIGTKDEEYTVSAFFDNDSNLCCYMSLRRELSKQGYTETAYTIELENIGEALLTLAEIFKPIGPTNFQFRKENNQLKLLEINPRISSATSIRTAFGYNESMMSIEYFLNNQKPAQPKLKNGYATRYTEDMIFYDSPNI